MKKKLSAKDCGVKSALWDKFLDIMKKSLILTIFLFNIVAFAYSQKVSINAKNQSVSNVLKTITKKTNVEFFYSDDVFDAQRRVNISVNNADIMNVIKELIGDDYKAELVNNKLIVIALTQKAKTIKSSLTEERVKIKGVVTNVKKEFLIGATVWVKGTKDGAITNFDGSYEIMAKKGDVLIFEYLGYKKLEVTVTDSLIINPILLEDVSKLDEVKIVSTGYQKIDRERSTGSFVAITAKDLEKVPVNNVLHRLEGQVAGLQLNILDSDNTFVYGTTYGDGQGRNSYNVAIRGKSTLETNAMPLIVLDGTPTELDIRTINPNDIEKITFLKDAASASIYGARAANGVMVIDTKKGKQGKTRINFSQNYGFSNKPSLSKLPLMNSSQVLNLEQEFVDKNLVSDPASISYMLTTPVSQGMDLMFQYKRGDITEAQKNAGLDVLRNRNTYGQAEKYLLQAATTQNYNLSFSGAENDYSYFMSGSYSKEETQAKGNSGQRLTLLSNQDFKLFNYLKMSTSLRGSIFKYADNGLGIKPLGISANTLLPYDQIVGDDGNSVNYYQRYYSAQTIPLEQAGYLPWTYNYIDELKNSDKSSNELNFGATISATAPILKGLDAVGTYSIEDSRTSNDNMYNQDTFFARDRINSTTSINNNGDLVNAIPKGGIYQNNEFGTSSYTVRGQLNYDGIIGQDHLINAMGGIEARETRESQDSRTLFGYNPKTQTSVDIPSMNYIDVNGYNYTLQYGNDHKDVRRRFLSYYGNAGYTYKNKYTITGSARLDDYNNFGVDKRLRRTPLWSTGAKWNIKEESFLKESELFNSLSLRASYGYNGNINLDVFPFTNISLSNLDTFSQQPFAFITAPANPNLRWEKTAILNFGVDFSILNNRLGGTIEYYTKDSKDLIVDFPISPFYGVQNNSLKQNAATISGKGVDVSLNATILKSKDFTWDSGLVVSYNTSEVTDSRFQNFSQYLNGSGGTTPVKGYPLNSVFAFRSAGLDATGRTQVYDKSGNIVNSFTSLKEIDDMKYMGTNIPSYFGSFSHTFTYKKVSLYILATYKFDYVLFKPTYGGYVNRQGRFNQYDLNTDIDQRWRNPGDEATTSVPGIQGSTGLSYIRYINGEDQIFDGDHIRFRELSLKYDLKELIDRGSITGASVTFTARNLGFFWRKNKDGLDPDFLPYTGTNMKLPAMAIYSIGFNVNF
ncbi:SusC/RagA family TonB-linked outer membrane protein [Flavobacterium reichenbachii]|uniref:TonB-dependent receptor n=1 Tax=Flavobacterium reichenbachii TaxID=362418 RepID=A0A085ZI68_9FLAO|nr:SusC/RagA family TonB-linked outer membrane protein [Flavobacterium reichenbachii]KFF04132.1 TonB-dependent receptor [Flavobacterium reichenbachii]OXB15826.1 SusC/RagA family TonB-linked outer membrane protein [Flavobacterium reichenbachii]